MKNKKLISLCLALVLLLAIPASAVETTIKNANQSESKGQVIATFRDYQLTETTSKNSEIIPYNAGEFYYRKTNQVMHPERWSEARRVSDNVQAGSAGGSITSSRTTTFHGSASGATSGLNFSFGLSKSSAIGYTLNVAPNSRVYLAYRVCYQEETGTRETVRYNGVVTYREPYSYDGIKYGEYLLVSY